jgi:hypothetical protein
LPGLAEYAATPGNLGVWVFRRTEGDVTHFLLTTPWESVEAIRQCAAEDYGQARDCPEGDDYLLAREPRVAHYDVLPFETETAPGAQ